MKSLNGLGILGNGKGKVRSWWMPRWCNYVRIVEQKKWTKVYILVNRKVLPVYDLWVVVKDDEVVRVYLDMGEEYVR